MQVLDRRLNPGGKNLENRQRFLRRAKALVQQAVRQSAQGARHFRHSRRRRGQHSRPRR